MGLFDIKPPKKIKKSKPFKPVSFKLKPVSFVAKPRQPKMKNLIFGYDRPKPARKVTGKLAMSWQQAKAKFPKMSPMGDADRDGVKNWLDCKPFDKKRQATEDAELYLPQSIDKFMSKSAKKMKISKKANQEDIDYVKKGLKKVRGAYHPGFKKTFIGGGWSQNPNVKDIASTLEHESVHSALVRMNKKKASRQLDNVQDQSPTSLEASASLETMRENKKVLEQYKKEKKDKDFAKLKEHSESGQLQTFVKELRNNKDDEDVVEPEEDKE